MERIMKMLTPTVSMVSAQDEPSGDITGLISHDYYYPAVPEGAPIRWGRKFTFRADKEGNVLSAEGLF